MCVCVANHRVHQTVNCWLICIGGGGNISGAGNLTPFAETQENVINIGTLQGRLIGQQCCGFAIQVRFQRCSQLFRIVQCRTDLLDVWWHIFDHARLAEWWHTHGVAGLRSGDQKGGEAKDCEDLA